jgi:hypothetical protein
MKLARFVFPLLALMLVSMSFVHSPQAVAQQSGRLRIDRAVYGRNGQGMDVTMRLRSYIKNNTIDIKVSNGNLGGDPNQGADKLLRVQYTYLGRHLSAVVKEGDRLKLP